MKTVANLSIVYFSFVLFTCACGDDADTPGTETDSGSDSETASSDGFETPIPEGFDLQGHRGARGLQPEHTLPGFETALDLAITTLEMDLHFTADRVLVIWHDEFIKATKCGIDPLAAEPLPPDPDVVEDGDTSLYIANLNYEQLAKYRCDRNPSLTELPEQAAEATDMAGDDYRIVKLETLFDFVEDYSSHPIKSDQQRANALRVGFSMETKRDPEAPENINDDFDGVSPGAFEKAIIALLASRELIDRTIIQSFDLRSLWATRTLNSDIRLSALSSFDNLDFEMLVENGAQIWSPQFLEATSQKIEEAHAAGLLVIPYTVNETANMQSLIDDKVDGFITDRPDLTLTLF